MKIRNLIRNSGRINEIIIVGSFISLFIFRFIYSKYIGPVVSKSYEVIFTIHDKPDPDIRAAYIVAFFILNIFILLEAFSVKIKRYYLTSDTPDNPEDSTFNILVTHNLFFYTRVVFSFIMAYFSAVCMINFGKMITEVVKFNWTNGTLVFNSEKIVVLTGILAFIIVMFIGVLYVLAFAYPRYGIKDLILLIEEKFQTERGRKKAKYTMLIFSELFATLFTFFAFTLLWETKFLLKSLITVVFKTTPYFPLNVYDIPHNVLQFLLIMVIVFFFVIFAKNISLMCDMYNLKGRNGKIRFAVYFIILLIFVLAPFYKFYAATDYYRRGLFHYENKQYEKSIDDLKRAKKSGNEKADEFLIEFMKDKSK